MDDEQLIARVLQGDREAFRGLVDRYQRLLSGWIRSIVGARGEVDDIAQETLLAAYRHLASYDACRGTFATWLLTIARRQCLSALSRRGPATCDQPPAPLDRQTPLERAGDGELMAALDASLAELPESQRTAFILAEVHELSYGEIALIEGVELGTVKSRIARAKQRLRTILANWRLPDGAPESSTGCPQTTHRSTWDAPK